MHADISTNEGGSRIYTVERSAGIDQRGCVEPLSMQRTSAYTHMNWRNLTNPNGTWRHSPCGPAWIKK